MKDQAKAIELMMRGHISTLTEEQQARVRDCFERMRALRKEYGDEGEIAFALDGAVSAQE